MIKVILGHGDGALMKRSVIYREKEGNNLSERGYREQGNHLQANHTGIPAQPWKPPEE